MTTAELTWSLGDGAQARPFEPDESGAIFDLVLANREHLDRWLLWSNSIQAESDAAATIAKYVTRRDAGLGFNCGIWVGDRLAGGIVCRDLNPEDRNAEIGYWLGSEFTGRGLATAAATMATDYLIRIRDMHRVTMHCAGDNVRSRAIPERLGYTLDGILRESNSLNGQFYDQAVYSVLAREWPHPRQFAQERAIPIRTA